MIVDFPDPDDPTIAVNFPAGIASEIFLRTVTSINSDKLRWVPSGREGYIKLTLVNWMSPLRSGRRPPSSRLSMLGMRRIVWKIFCAAEVALMKDWIRGVSWAIENEPRSMAKRTLIRRPMFRSPDEISLEPSPWISDQKKDLGVYRTLIQKADIERKRLKPSITPRQMISYIPPLVPLPISHHM